MNMIKVESLNKSIKGKAILKDISFEVAEGECVALIGPNGAGKTTLLDCLLGDKLVTSGQVSIQGLPVTSSQLDYTRSYLPQENVIVQIQSLKLSFQLRWFKVFTCLDFSSCSSPCCGPTVDFSENRS